MATRTTKKTEDVATTDYPRQDIQDSNNPNVQTAQNPAPTPTTWEYKAVDIHIQDGDLSGLGAKGWELVGIYNPRGTFGTAWLKRPVYGG